MATTQEELDLAFTEVGTQLKARVTAKGSTKGLWVGTEAAYQALKTAAQLEAGVAYITVG